MAKSVRRVEGVRWADLNFASGVLLLEYDAALDPRQEVASIARRSGHGVELIAEEGTAAATGVHGRPWDRVGHAALTGAAGVLAVAGWLAGLAGIGPVSAWFYGAAIISGGAFTFRRAWMSLRARALDMNVLMSLAVIGAASIGEWSEGATVVFLFSLGGLLESRALARTRRSIRDLMSLTPPVARVRIAGLERELPLGEVAVGNRVIVRPGERVPLDGRVRSGASAVDESTVTGESVPVDKTAGSEVFAGTLNTNGLLEVEVSSTAEHSLLARLILMVEEAQASRAPVQQLVDRFTRYYTPAVVGVAIAVALVPPTLAAILDVGWLSSTSWHDWFYRGLALLVISCPCALVISTPVAIVSAITRAARDGVLVKGGAFLELAARVGAVAFDKTGTLTFGRPEVSEVVSLGKRDAAYVLATAAALEGGSSHPIAEAVVRAAGGRRAGASLTDFEDVAGRGIRGRLDGVWYAVGSPLLADEMGAMDARTSVEVARLEDAGHTVLVLVEETRALGVVGVADQVRDTAHSAVAGLRDRGVAHVVMLTGDNERTAAGIAAQVGLDEFRARLLPEDKIEAVGELQKAHGVVAMVGDGINDAPALARSDIGIAMGAAGSDTALETADVALMTDNLAALPGFFSLGRRTVANIRQNVGFSVLVKVVVLVLAVAGYATLWMAVFADTGVSLLVILNGLRLLRR